MTVHRQPPRSLQGGRRAAPQRRRLLKRPVDVAGESASVAGFGGTGAVSFEYVASGATVFAPTTPTRDRPRSDRAAAMDGPPIHEFLHQLLPKVAIHDSNDRTVTRAIRRLSIEGYFGDLHWDIARPELERRIKRR